VCRMSDPILAKIPNYCTYLCYSPDTTEAAARAGFVRRYGRQPQEVVRDHCLIWTGPIENHENK
jgi:hypothetical protein